MSLQKDKTDPILGKEVQKYLIRKKVNTPFAKNENSENYQLATIENNFRDIMKTLNLDLGDDSLKDTPKRFAKMFVKELFWGLNPENFPKCTTVENKMKYDEMVVEKNISVMSSCEHHFVTIDGLATIGYIPENKVLGLSKMNRIVEYFSRRPQIQERLTEQIYYALCYILQTNNVAVLLNCAHYCVKSRGVEDSNSLTITSKLGGSFKTESALRNEFMMITRG